MARAYIAIGSNLGDRASAVQAAVERMGALADTRLAAVATLRETAPVDSPAGAGPFLNTAAVLETRLAPLDLLKKLFDIERMMGRKRGEGVDGIIKKNLPRIIDLDLVLYDDVVMNSEELILPHPRMERRAFVLEPLAEIAPDVVHPLRGKTVGELWELLKSTPSI